MEAEAVPAAAAAGASASAGRRDRERHGGQRRLTCLGEVEAVLRESRPLRTGRRRQRHRRRRASRTSRRRTSASVVRIDSSAALRRRGKKAPAVAVRVPRVVASDELLNRPGRRLSSGCRHEVPRPRQAARQRVHRARELVVKSGIEVMLTADVVGSHQDRHVRSLVGTAFSAWPLSCFIFLPATAKLQDESQAARPSRCKWR